MSINGMGYAGADGSQIPNLGQRVVKAVMQSGHMTQMKFQVAAVTKALGSVSKIVQNGGRVVFDSPEYGGAYVMNKRTGNRSYLREENGVYVMDVWIPPNNSQGFPRQGM